MKVVYLGTAAAEGIPGMFCACETCRRAMERGGRNIMTRSQMLVNDDLLVDFNADTYQHFLKMNKTLWNIEHILITHAHTDHFTFEEFFCRFEGIGHGVKVEKLKMYMSKVAYDIMMRCIEAREIDPNGLAKRFEFVIVEPYTTIKVGEYTVHVLPARHASENEALLYVIEQNGRTLFYGNDTGVFSEDIDDYLKKQGVKINLLSLDCTNCDKVYNYYTHMNMAEGKTIEQRFRKKGLLAEDVKLYYTHFSHNPGYIYDDLVEIARDKYGFNVTYDGLVLEV